MLSCKHKNRPRNGIENHRSSNNWDLPSQMHNSRSGLCGMAMRERTTWGNAMYIYVNAIEHLFEFVIDTRCQMRDQSHKTS